MRLRARWPQPTSCSIPSRRDARRSPDRTPKTRSSLHRRHSFAASSRYAHTTYLGNPISPLPGAIILATPFAVIGRVSLQNVCWLAAFAVFLATFFRDRATALAFLTVMLLGALNTLDQFVVGGDYPINTWYVVIATALFLATTARRPAALSITASGLLLGLALSSRFVYPLVFLPLIGAFLWQQNGLASALRRVSIPAAVAAAVTLPIYLHDPSAFAPLHVTEKLNFLAPVSRHMAAIMLPIIACATASAGFWWRLTLERLLLVAGVASAVVLLTPGAIRLVQDPFSLSTWELVSYASPAALCLALWAFRELEDGMANEAAVNLSTSRSDRS